MGIPRLRLFGVPRLEDESGLELRLRTKKQLGLLVYLTLEGRDRPVSRAYLVELLWPDASPENARHSLAQALSAIRSRLGSNALTRGGEIVQLFGGLETDLDHIAERFADLDVARPLEHLEVWAGADFAHWVDGARRRCVQIAVEQLREAVHRLRAEGATAQVYECAAKLYQLDPLSDVAVLVLAEASLVRGDVVGAIQLLRDHVHRYQDTVNCNPPCDVERLLRRLEAGAHPPIEAVPPHLAREARTIRPKVFVGRRREMARLEAEWEQVRAGRSRSCHVVGPGGIGKSSLIRRFATRLAARAHPVFVVSCQEIGQGIPFAATADLITALCRDPSLSGTDPQWLAEASRVQPALRAAYPGIPDPPPAPPESIRIRVAEGLLHMIEAVGDGGPAAVFFDDVQYMDPATREVLFVLRRRLSDIPVLLVGTVRAGELDAELATSGAARSRMQWDEVIPLTPLDAETTEGLIDRLSDSLDVGNDSIRQKIVQLSEGNPYFVEMLVADWERHAAASLAASEAVGSRPAQDWRPPDNLRLAFARLYEGLDEHAQQMLHVLAVAGRGLAVEEMASCLGMASGLLDGGVLNAIDRDIVRIENGDLCFKNALHRAYAYWAMSEERRKFYHLKVGRTLGSFRETGEFQKLLESIYHFVRARSLDEAIKAAVAGTPLAIREGAPGEAEVALKLILECQVTSRRGLISLLLAESLAAQGKYRDALAVLTADVQEPADAMNAAKAAVMKAEALQRTRLGNDAAVSLAAADAVTLTRQAGDDRLVARALQVRAEITSETGGTRELVETRVEARRIAKRSPDQEGKARARFTEAFCLMSESQFEAASNVFCECIGQLAALPLDETRARAENGLGICRLRLAQYEDALPEFFGALTIAQKLTDNDYSAIAWSNLGVLYEEVGMFSSASRCYDEAFQLDSQSATPRRLALSQINLADMSIINGDFDDAAKWVSKARVAATDTSLAALLTGVDLAEADLLIARGETELAWPLVERALGRSTTDYRRPGLAGRLTRLRLSFMFATDGQDSLLQWVDEHTVGALGPPDSLEVMAFLEWAIGDPRSPPPHHSKLEDQLIAAGRLGLLARLASVRIALSSSTVARPGESAAGMVERVFPWRHRSVVLREVEHLLEERERFERPDY